VVIAVWSVLCKAFYLGLKCCISFATIFIITGHGSNGVSGRHCVLYKLNLLIYLLTYWFQLSFSLLAQELMNRCTSTTCRTLLNFKTCRCIFCLHDAFGQ